MSALGTACFLSYDQRQDFLCEGNDDTAREGEKAIAALGRVVGLKGQADLHNSPAEQDHAHGADQAEDEVAQVVDYG